MAYPSQSRSRNAFVFIRRTRDMFCETPGQSAVAAVLGGLLGGVLGVTLGFGVVGVAALAGVLGGTGDVVVHLFRRDEQFQEAVCQIRR
jgi:outer membrane lipoprotein SlyB